MASDSENTEYVSIDAILESFPDAILVTDQDLNITRLNGRASDLLGIPSIDLPGMSMLDLVPEPEHDQIRQLGNSPGVEPNADPRAQAVELTIQTQTVARLPCLVSAAPIDVSGQQCVMFTLRDISQQKQLENRIEMSELLLAEAQRVARIGSWRWVPESNTVIWSRELKRIFGVPQDAPEITYEQYLEFIHPEDRERVHQAIREAMEQRTAFEVEHRMVRPDGGVRLIYGRGTVGLDDDDRLVSLTGTAQDITDEKAHEAQAFQLALEQAARQEAERTRERFQFLAEVSNTLGSSLEFDETLDNLMSLLIPRLADWCSMNNVDQDGMISRIAVAHRDPRKKHILETVRSRNYLPHQDVNHPLTRAFREQRGQLLPNITEAQMQSLARSEEHFEFMRELSPTSAMFIPLIARGRAFGVVTFGMSDSGRHYDEDDLELATEIAHRAAASIDNATLYLEAQNAARGREEFVSLVSHELKTPLTVIKGYMQVLERYLDKPDWDRERILITRDRLSSQVKRLELLVADILDVSRTQHGRLELNLEHEVDIVDLAGQVINRFDDAVERKPEHEFRLHAAEPVTGRWDPLRLDQVFSNLLSNALKYSPDGGAIEVDISMDSDQAIINVSDEGVGISAEEQQRLFQPFHRGAASARGITGTGLGLYITRQIIEEHGGRISVNSTPGNSTTFRILLPVSPERSDDQVLVTKDLPSEEASSDERG